MQGSTDHSVQLSFDWDLRIFLGSISNFCSVLIRPGPSKTPEVHINCHFWSGSVRNNSSEPTGFGMKIPDFICVSWDANSNSKFPKFSKVKHFERGNLIFNAIRYFSAYFRALSCTFENFRALFWDSDRFSKYLHHRVHSLVIPNSLNSCFSFF